MEPAAEIHTEGSVVKSADGFVVVASRFVFHIQDLDTIHCHY